MVHYVKGLEAPQKCLSSILGQLVIYKVGTSTTFCHDKMLVLDTWAISHLLGWSSATFCRKNFELI
jgi:hypothetical protein